MRISNNTVLITGGATGIGFAMAAAFLEAGSQVILCGRRKEKLERARAEHPELHIKVCDVGKMEECRELAAWVGEHFKDLNVLVNNAGVQRDIDLVRDDVDSYLAGESEIRINLEAPIALCGLFVPLLMGRNEPAIVNVSSGLGFVPAARVPIYSATKAGLHAFSMALRHQLSKVGIKVYEIVPPAVDTDLNAEGRARRGGFKVNVTAEEFTVAVMKGLEADLPEIGYGMSSEMLSASRCDLDRIFQEMNSRW